MKANNEEIINLLKSLEDFFNEDLTNILEYVNKSNYSYDDENDNYTLHTYSEIGDLFRRNIIPYNIIFSENDIKEILIKDKVLLYDFIKKQYLILESDELIKLKNIDIKAFGKFVY